jgi:type I restriction enzyme S subunit
MTMHDGLVNQADKFKKRVASRDTASYKVVKRHQLVVGFPIDEGVLSFQELYDAAIVSPAYGIWDLRKPDQVDRDYLERYLRSPRALAFYTAKLRSTTARRRSLPRETFLSMPIPLPPLPEQRRIAAILDKADAVRRKRRQTLDLADQFLRSAFLDMFGDPVTNPKRWPVKKLGNCITDKPRIGTIARATDGGSVAVVRVGDLGQFRLPNFLPTHVNLDLPDIKRFQIAPGDFLLARAIGSEEHLGKASVVRANKGGSDQIIVFDSHVMRLRFDEAAIHPVFFWQWMKTSGGRALFMRNAGRTAVQFNINATQITRIAIALPPEELQAQFVRIALDAKKLHETLDGTSEKCAGLSGSLVQLAFRGEL